MGQKRVNTHEYMNTHVHGEPLSTVIPTPDGLSSPLFNVWLWDCLHSSRLEGERQGGPPCKRHQTNWKQVMSLLLTFHWPGLRGSPLEVGLGHADPSWQPQLRDISTKWRKAVQIFGEHLEGSATRLTMLGGLSGKICWFEFLYLDPIRCHGELCIWEKFFWSKDVHVSLLPMPLKWNFSQMTITGEEISPCNCSISAHSRSLGSWLDCLFFSLSLSSICI